MVKSIHEVHCTVCDEDKVGLDRFLSLCAHNKIKVIHVDNGITKVSRHIMTTSTQESLDDAHRRVWFINQIAGVCGIKVLRRKIEVQPSAVDAVFDDHYFEMHANIRVADISDAVYDYTKWFVSQNAGKAVIGDKKLYMLTMRGYNTTLAQFEKEAHESLQSFKHLLDDKEHLFIEKCILDDNVKMDDHWMRPYV